MHSRNRTFSFSVNKYLTISPIVAVIPRDVKWPRCISRHNECPTKGFLQVKAASDGDSGQDHQ